MSRISDILKAWASYVLKEDLAARVDREDKLRAELAEARKQAHDSYVKSTEDQVARAKTEINNYALTAKNAALQAELDRAERDLSSPATGHSPNTDGTHRLPPPTPPDEDKLQ